MKFEALPVHGAFLITPETHRDHRGSFTRMVDAGQLAKHGLETHFAQFALSTNPQQGTLRGMHYQAAPHSEAKLVRCARGKLHDVIMDIRRDSPSYGKHVGVTLEEGQIQLLYVPAGCGHGYLTLAPGSDLEYHISKPYVAEAGRGLRFNDPFFGVIWPGEIASILERDANYPDWQA